MADKGYNSNQFVRWVEERDEIVVIPSRVKAKHPRHIDWHTYKERHLADNLFLKFKNNHRFATRYEKKRFVFMLSSALPVPLFGYSDGFKTGSSPLYNC